MERLYGTLELRATNDELREFEGIANTAALDSHDTVVEPAGARLSIPHPLLWFHGQQSPVGTITSAQLIDGRWNVKGSVPRVAEPGIIRDTTDQAWHAIKYKLVRGLSIGFTPLKEKGNHFIEWLWRETSLVTIPSNQEASIVSVRSAYLAASGESTTPGVSGHSTTSNPTPRHGKMTIQEQITQHENSRAAKVARQSALMDAAGTEGTTLDESQAEEYDTLTREVEAIDGHLTRLSSLKRANDTAAVAVNGSSTASASQSRGNGELNLQSRPGVPVVRTRPNEPPGLGFARYVMSLANSAGSPDVAAMYAKRTWPDAADEVVSYIQTRAAVAPGTTQQATFAAPLVPTNFLNEFLELLRPATLIGRIPGLRHVPFNISMPSQTAGGTYKWVGETKPKPVTNAQFAAITLGMAKAAGIIVLSEELVRSSQPAAQEVVRDEMIKGITQFLDGQFIDPAIAAVANVNPASITNGVAGTATAGATEANIRTDLKVLLGAYSTANLNLGGVVLLMSENSALGISMMTNAVGSLAFPGMTPTGGAFLGFPVVVSNTVGARIVAVHAPSILIADEGGVEIDISREASVEMDSVPTDPVVGATVFVSLWQANLVGLRAERFINWGKARTGAVQMITGVAYA